MPHNTEFSTSRKVENTGRTAIVDKKWVGLELDQDLVYIIDHSLCPKWNVNQSEAVQRIIIEWLKTHEGVK